ncbi:hypothetical protein DJ95_3852 [Bacillus atrophaeus subsp. globigii]|nr:hypothetical protein DJ95_3852 [Bacillus atrophaeus subsp. globigii]KFK80983.1 hypothetical protein DK44_3779 [Bacillus atrophaeus]
MGTRVSYPVEAKPEGCRNEIGRPACKRDHAGIEYHE